MLAYSGISHAGLSVDRINCDGKTIPKRNHLLFAGIFTFYNHAFGVLMLVSKEKTIDGQPNERYEAFNGLAKQKSAIGIRIDGFHAFTGRNTINCWLLG
jgi:NADH-quinone oxidoreductase subunit N